MDDEPTNFLYSGLRLYDPTLSKKWLFGSEFYVQVFERRLFGGEKYVSIAADWETKVEATRSCCYYLAWCALGRRSV